MIEIILESFSDLFKGLDAFLKTRDLTIGAILAGVAPFILIWIKISKEKEKRSRSILVERRQLQIAFNVNEIMEKLGVESKWNLAEIGSTHTVQKSSKPWLTIFTKVIQKKKLLYPRRNKKMKLLLNNPWSKKLFAFLLLVAVNGLNDTLGLNLSHDTVSSITGVGQIYIISQAAVDMFKPLLVMFIGSFKKTGVVEVVDTKPTVELGANK